MLVALEEISSQTNTRGKCFRLHEGSLGGPGKREVSL